MLGRERTARTRCLSPRCKPGGPPRRSMPTLRLPPTTLLAQEDRAARARGRRRPGPVLLPRHASQHGERPTKCVTDGKVFRKEGRCRGCRRFSTRSSCQVGIEDGEGGRGGLDTASQRCRSSRASCFCGQGHALTIVYSSSQRMACVSVCACAEPRTASSMFAPLLCGRLKRKNKVCHVA